MSNIEQLERLAKLKDLKGISLSTEEIERIMASADTNGKKAERALTNPKTTPFSTYSIEELESTSIITTPRDTPLLNLLRNRTQKSRSLLYEWNEVEVQSDPSLGAYDGNTVPSDVAGTPTRKSNYIMPVATVPKVSRFTNSFESTDENALENELAQKFLDVNRSIEYFLWNGDSTVVSPATETDGVIKLVTTAVTNGSGALKESKLQEAILQIASEGGEASHAFCTHTVAQRIVSFTDDKIEQADPRTAVNGVGEGGLTYLNPFGRPISVVPVITTFLPTGSVYVLSLDMMYIMHTMNQIINLEKLGIITHGDAFIYFSFFGLKLKNASKAHRVITNVSDLL